MNTKDKFDIDDMVDFVLKVRKRPGIEISVGSPFIRVSSRQAIIAFREKPRTVCYAKKGSELKATELGNDPSEWYEVLGVAQ